MDQETEAVLFDIDDTLFPSSEFSKLARKNAIGAMVDAGLNTTQTKAEEELNQIIQEHGSNYGSHFNKLVNKIGCKDKDHCIAAGIWAYHNTKSSISPYPKVTYMLLKLRERGCIVCAASEGRALKQWDKLIRLGLDHLFDHVFVTNKKDVAFYKRLTKKLKFEPNQILMIGDNPKKDIIPAKEAGLKTVRLMRGRHIKIDCRPDKNLKTIDDLLSFLKI